MVPLETVRGVYERLSREAVEAQLTRPLPGRRVPSNVVGDAEEAGSRDVTIDDEAGKKSALERTAAAAAGGGPGRATSAPVTPVHRPPGPGRDVTGTDRDVGGGDDDELPQRGLTRALVAQWRELEERARDELRARAGGTSRSRSLSGLALRRAAAAAGESPSPPSRRHPEQGRSGADRRDVVTAADGSDEDQQLAPPLMTQYMLAKFRDMEAETHGATAGRHAKDRKVTLQFTGAVDLSTPSLFDCCNCDMCQSITIILGTNVTEKLSTA